MANPSCLRVESRHYPLYNPHGCVFIAKHCLHFTCPCPCPFAALRGSVGCFLANGLARGKGKDKKDKCLRKRRERRELHCASSANELRVLVLLRRVMKFYASQPRQGPRTKGLLKGFSGKLAAIIVRNQRIIHGIIYAIWLEKKQREKLLKIC